MPIGDYDFTKTADVTSDTGTPTISGFPALVRIEGTGTDSTGTGIATIDESGTTIDGQEDVALYDENDNLLDYYWERFDTTNDVYIAWVRQSITRDGTTQLKIGFGNGSTDESVTPETVFDSVTNLTSAYLFNEASGSLLDRTSANNDSVSVTVTSREVDSDLGYAYDFDGTDDLVDITNFSAFSSGVSVLYVARHDTPSDGDNDRAISLEENNQFFFQDDGAGTYEWRIGPSSVTASLDANQHTFAFTNDGAGNNEGFLDGTSQGTVSESNSASANGDAFGAREDDIVNFDGLISGIFIYGGTVLSDDYIQAFHDMTGVASYALFSWNAAESTATRINAAVTSATATPINTATVDKTVSAAVEAATGTPLTATDNAIAEETAAVTQATATPLTAAFDLPILVNANITSATATPLTATKEAIASRNADITAAVATPLTVEGRDIVIASAITSSTGSPLTATAKTVTIAPALTGDTLFLLDSTFKWFDMGGRTTFKTGDEADKLSGTLKDDAGAVDVSGSSTIELYLEDRDGNTVVNAGSMDFVTDGTDGQVEYDWAAGDTDTAAIMKGEIVVTWTDGEETFPNDGFFTVTFEDDLQ